MGNDFVESLIKDVINSAYEKDKTKTDFENYAQVLFTCYSSLVNAGFTEEQAFQLIQTITIAQINNIQNNKKREY